MHSNLKLNTLSSVKMAPKENFPQTFEDALASIVKKEGYITYKVDKEIDSTKGIGFIAKPFFVTIKGQTADGEKETNIFVKTAVEIVHINSVLNVSRAFLSEAFVYDELSQIFTELQDEASIPPSDRLMMVRSFGESNSKAIFLENVALQGYECPPRISSVTLPVAELALKDIAKFHAFSFIIRERRPELYKRMTTFESPMIFGKDFKEGMLHVTRSAAEHLNESSKEKVLRVLPDLVKKWEYYNRGGDGTGSCLCHGDLRLHNLMIKQKDDETDVLIVDYQMIHMNSPVHDLLFFIYTSTNGAFRKNHFSHLKDFYYEAFSDFLSKFQLDSEDVYSRQQYEKDFKERLDFGLACGLYFMTITLTADNEIPDPEETALTDAKFVMHSSFSKRLQDIVDDYIEWGLL